MAQKPALKALTKKLDRSWLKVSGSDALRFLNGMWTCDFKRIAQATQDAKASGVASLGSGVGFLLNAKGMAVSEAVVVCENEQSFLFSLPSQALEGTYDALNHYLVADDVELDKVEACKFSHVLVCSNSSLEPATPSMWQKVSVPKALDRVAGARVEPWGLRIPLGTLGTHHEEFWVLQKAALPFEVEALNDEAYLEARIDAGVAEWGVDLAPDALVLEFPYEDRISFHKGCYIGQEVIARATYRGRMTRGFSRFHAEGALVAGDFIFHETDLEKPVGKITSAHLNRGLGLIRLSALEGGKLFQKTRGGATVAIDRVEVLLSPRPESKTS